MLKLSIIIATYNSGKTLQATLDSLLFQTYKNFEVVLIDGLSTDNTVAIIKENEALFTAINIPYFWSSEKDSGIYDAWNKGLQLVNSSWIAFLGSDDVYIPTALEEYSNQINQTNHLNYISSKVEIVDVNNKILKVIGTPFDYKQIIKWMDIAHVGSFHHINLFQENGNFSSNYKIAGDYEFFLRAGKVIKAGYINKILVKMLNSGVSNQQVNLVLAENLRLHLEYKQISFFQSYFHFYLAHLKAIKRKYFLLF